MLESWTGRKTRQSDAKTHMNGVTGLHAQRERNASLLEAGVDDIDGGTIFRGEPGRSEILCAIIIVELGLNAGYLWPMIGEGEDGFLELIRLRLVLRVENHDKLPFGLEQAEIARARLGLWAAFGNREYGKISRQAHAVERRACFVIVLLREKKDLQFLRWIIERLDGFDKLRHDGRFFVKRTENSIRRPFNSPLV